MGSIFKIGFMISLMDKLSGPMANVKAKLGVFERFSERAFGRFRNVASNALGEAGRRAEAFKQRLAGVTTKINAVGEAGTKLFLIGTALLVPFTLAARGFAIFEDAAAKFRSTGVSVMGDMDRSMEMVEQRSLSFAAHNRQTAVQYLDAAYTMVAATQDEIAAIEGTDWALKMATATFADHQSAANMLATAYLNIGDKTRPVREEFGHLADVITKTQQTFKLTDLGALAEGFKYVAGSAVAEGLGLEQLMTSLGQLNDVLEGSQAGTALNQALAHLSKASRSLGFEIERTASGGLDLIKTLGNMSDKLGHTSTWTDRTRESLRMAFGDEGYRAIVGLLPKLGEMEDKFGDISSAAGVTQSTVDDLNTTWSAKIDRIKNQLSGLGVTFAKLEGTGFQGRLNGISQDLVVLQRFIEIEPELAGSAADSTLKFALLTVGLGLFGRVLKFVWPLVSGLATALTWLSGLLKGGGIGGLLRGIAPVYAEVALVYAALKSQAESYGMDLREVVGEMFSPGTLIKLEDWSGFLGALWEMINPASLFREVWNFWVVLPLNQSKKDFEALILWFRGSGKRLWQEFKDGLSEGWGDVKTYFSEKLTWISGLFPHSEPKWGPLRGLMRAGETTMRMYAEGIRRGAADLARTTAGALALSAPRPALAAAGGGRHVTISVGDIVIHDRSGDSRDTAERVRQAVLQVLREASEEV
ncbi:MAG: phage tail tape measure protein [Candidatus Alcyoniella australis]|nr:phage tail tape measure protein [Candidatus Alcyoniella australis]